METALLIACKLNNDEIAEVLIDQGSDINTCDENKTNPLICAVKNDNITLLRLLLKQPNLNITWKDRLNNTCYDYAKSDEIRAKIYQKMEETLDLIDPFIYKGIFNQ